MTADPAFLPPPPDDGDTVQDDAGDVLPDAEPEVEP